MDSTGNLPAKAVKRMDDDRYLCPSRSDASDSSRFGAVGVNDVILMLSKEVGDLIQRQYVSVR